MAREDWYLRTPQELKYSGYESDGYEESANQFEGALLYANNSHDIEVTRYINDSTPDVVFDTRVLISSNVESKHDVKQVTYRKGEIRIGDIYLYQDEIYLTSKWSNRDIKTYDNIESVLCNTQIKSVIETETQNGTDKFGKEKFIVTIEEKTEPCYYNSQSDTYLDDQLINLPRYEHEVWVSYKEYFAIDLEVIVFGNKYTIYEVDKTYTKQDGSGNTYGMLRLALKTRK